MCMEFSCQSNFQTLLCCEIICINRKAFAERKIKMQFARSVCMLRRLFISNGTHTKVAKLIDVYKLCNNKLTLDDNDVDERWYDGRLILKSYQINIVPFTNTAFKQT